MARPKKNEIIREEQNLKPYEWDGAGLKRMVNNTYDKYIIE